METLVLVARLVLAGVFVASAVAKLLDRAGSRQAVADFRVPAPLVGVVTVAMPVVELVAAVLLLVADPGATAGALLSAGLLVAFTVAILVNLGRGRRPDCHCFGQLSTKPLGWRTVARNVVLLALTGVVLTDAGSMPAVTSYLRGPTATQLAVGAALVVLAGGLVALGALFYALLRRYGALLLRVEELESVVGHAGGHLHRHTAPPFTLPSLDGASVSLADLLAAGRPLVLSVIAPHCSACDELLPDLARWQADPDGPSVAVVSSGSPDDVRAKIADVPGLHVLLEEREITDGYRVEFTPGAVAVGPDGVLLGSPAYGADEIRALYRGLAGADDPALWQIGPRPLAVGDPAPDVPLTTEAGQPVGLVEATAAVGDDAVLLFWDPTCGFAEQIRDRVQALEGEVPVVLVSRGDPAAVRASGLRSPLLTDPGFAAGQAYGAPGTPSAVRVKSGRVASAVAVGGPEVVDLLQVGRGQS